jgi:hypothetical protein
MDPLEALKAGDTEALQAMLNGEEPTAPEPAPTPEPVEDIVPEVPVEEPPAEPPVTSETPEEVPAPEASVADLEIPETPALPDTKEIFITDSEGRRPYTLDFTDRPKIEKAFQYAAGFRKMQAERDKAISANKEQSESYKKLEAAWGEGGVEGIKNVISTLAGGDEGVTAFIDNELAERQRLADMSPEEKASYESKRQQELQRLEWETKMGDLTAKEKAHAASLEKAEEERLYNKAAQAQARFSFTGRLGNEKTENMWNRTLAQEAVGMLDKHAEKMPEGWEPSQANFNKAFEIAYANLSNSLQGTASKQAEKTIGKAKANAAKAAANVAKKGMQQPATASQEVLDALEAGDTKKGMAAIFSSGKKFF